VEFVLVWQSRRRSDNRIEHDEAKKMQKHTVVKVLVAYDADIGKRDRVGDSQ